MRKAKTIPEAARQAQKELFKLKAVNPTLATYYAKKYNKIIKRAKGKGLITGLE